MLVQYTPLAWNFRYPCSLITVTVPYSLACLVVIAYPSYGGGPNDRQSCIHHSARLGIFEVFPNRYTLCYTLHDWGFHQLGVRFGGIVGITIVDPGTSAALVGPWGLRTGW